MRETAPLGAALTTTSVEEPAPEEEEEEEEEEGEDDDGGMSCSQVQDRTHITTPVVFHDLGVVQHLTVKTMNKTTQMMRMIP